MSPPKKKRPLRKSEGRPEMRNPNQILAEAASRISGDLPKKGKKLELNSYFRSGEGHRMANRILKDNGVIPQHLHDRKDAEEARAAAEAQLKSDLAQLSVTIATTARSLNGYEAIWPCPDASCFIGGRGRI